MLLQSCTISWLLKAPIASTFNNSALSPNSMFSSRKSSLSPHALMTNLTGSFYTLIVLYMKFLCLYLGLIKITFSCPTLVMMANYWKMQDHSVESSYEIWKVAARPKSAAVSLLRLRVCITPAAWMSLSCECCVLSGRDLCDGPIPRPEKSYRVCLSLSAMRSNSKTLHLQWVGRRVQNKK